jgi:hypothetical protein
MAIWKHTICAESFEDPGTPVRCPLDVIPTCENPTAGFDLVNPSEPYVWKCKSCGWLVESEVTPSQCPSVTDEPCPDPEGGSFSKTCD